MSVRPDGKPGIVAHEARTYAVNTPAQPRPEAAGSRTTAEQVRRAQGRGVSEAEFEQQAQRLAAQPHRAMTPAPAVPDFE